jgi:DNA-directed RNA polymerase
MQLHERYRDYKLPIEALTQRSISKWIVKDNLPEHIKVSLMALKDDHLSEENESDLEGDEEDATADPNLAANKSNTSTTSEVAEPRTEKKTRRSTPRKADISKLVDQKYVNLIDVLPPVPEKGKFDIQVVKDSSYFFS